MKTVRSPWRTRFVSPVLWTVRDPVIVFLVLAGFFDGISGNPIHSLLLFGAAVALAWDRNVRLPREAAGVAVSTPGVVGTELPSGGISDDESSRAAVIPFALAGIAIFAFVVGGFGRYSWPATLAVLVLGFVAIAVGWHGPLRVRPDPGRLDPLGAVAWWFVIVAASMWELMALFQQPTLSTDSWAHPTLSVLTDAALTSHLGRSIALVVWLALGWFLVER